MERRWRNSRRGPFSFRARSRATRVRDRSNFSFFPSPFFFLLLFPFPSIRELLPLSSISKISDLPTRFVTVDAHYSDSELFVIEGGGGGGGLEKSKRVDRFSAVSSFASFFARSFARYLFLPLCIRILLLLLRSPEFN